MNFDVTRNLDDFQLDSFKQLKQRITEQHGAAEAEDEARLVRFLIARDFNVDKAETMLNNHIRWRRKHRIDDLLHSYKPPEVLEQYYPIIPLGYSKDGDFVCFLDFGAIDFIGLGKSTTRAEFTMYLTHLFEGYCKKMQDKSEKEGKLIQTWIFIFDFEKTSLSQVTNKDGMDLLISVLPIYEANYPERLKYGIMINASVAFTIAYAVLKPLLEERTKNKLKIFGKNGWKEELLNILDPEVLPAFLGGTRTDPDGNPMCLSFVKRGGIVPQKYYYSTKSERSLCSQPRVKKYVVSRLSRVTVRIDVPESGSKIEWEFQTENYDIGFGLRYIRMLDNGNVWAEDVIPVNKVDTRVFCETGMYYCEKAGTYMLVFDNSFSWLRSKQLYVRAEVVQPDGRKKYVTV